MLPVLERVALIPPVWVSTVSHSTYTKESVTTSVKYTQWVSTYDSPPPSKPWLDATLMLSYKRVSLSEPVLLKVTVTGNASAPSTIEPPAVPIPTYPAVGASNLKNKVSVPVLFTSKVSGKEVALYARRVGKTHADGFKATPAIAGIWMLLSRYRRYLTGFFVPVASPFTNAPGSRSIIYWICNMLSTLSAKEAQFSLLQAPAAHPLVWVLVTFIGCDQDRPVLEEAATYSSLLEYPLAEVSPPLNWLHKQ